MDPTSCTSSGRPRVNPHYHRSAHDSGGVPREPRGPRRARPRSNTVSAVVSRRGRDEEDGRRAPSSCGGRVSDFFSPEPAGGAHPPAGSGRPLGGIEKVLEYRPVPNGRGAVELRRMTPSAAGPVEHIQGRIS